MYSKFTFRYETFIDLEIRKELMLANTRWLERFLCDRQEEFMPSMIVKNNIIYYFYYIIYPI
jgi:hypothetical protein